MEDAIHNKYDLDSCLLLETVDDVVDGVTDVEEEEEEEYEEEYKEEEYEDDGAMFVENVNGVAATDCLGTTDDDGNNISVEETMIVSIESLT